MIQKRGLVTVVVPCFNNESTIGETIESVLAQTSSQWELICVDDGSTDSTVDIIRHYCEKDNRIKLMIRSEEPKGGSHCRNIGAFAAHGDFLIFLDGDDLLAETCIERRLYDIAGTTYEFVVFPMARFYGDNIENVIEGTKLQKKRNYLYYFSSGNAGWQITCPIIRTTFFRKLGGFNSSFPRLQDIEYNFRSIAAAGDEKYLVRYDAPYDCFYRQSSIIDQKKIKKNINGLTAYKLFLDLVIKYIRDGALFYSEKLSQILLCIYCNACIQYDYLKINKTNIEIPLWIYQAKKNKFISREYSLLLFVLIKSLKFPKLNFWFARIIGKILRSNF